METTQEILLVKCQIMIKENDLWFVFPSHCVSLAFSLLIASDTERVPFRDWFTPPFPAGFFSYFLLPDKHNEVRIPQNTGNTLGGIDTNWLVCIGVTFSFNPHCKIQSLAWLGMKQENHPSHLTSTTWTARGFSKCQKCCLTTLLIFVYIHKLGCPLSLLVTTRSPKQTSLVL